MCGSCIKLVNKVQYDASPGLMWLRNDEVKHSRALAGFRALDACCATFSPTHLRLRAVVKQDKYPFRPARPSCLVCLEKLGRVLIDLIGVFGRFNSEQINKTQCPALWPVRAI